MKIKMLVVDLEMSTRAKRVLAAAMIPAVLVGATAIAYANVSHVWVDGELLTAADLNQNFAVLDADITELDGRMAATEASQSSLQAATDALEAAQAADQVSIADLEATSTARLAGPAANMTSIIPVGSVNPSTQQTLWQAGTHVCWTDANGACTITFPQTFPNGLLTIVAQQGDTTHPHDAMVNRALSNSEFEVHFSLGGAPHASALVRVNWIAIGW